MAKNIKRNNKTDSNKWAAFWIGATAFIIVAAILAGIIGWRTAGFNDWTFGFGNEISIPNDTDNDYDNSNQYEVTNGGMTISDVVSNGVTLARARIASADYAEYGIDTQAETAYSLKATITPASADDKRVEWTVSDPSGTLNAADYITLEEFGLLATVACKQAFDHQFIVTVKSLDNPEAKATCTLDYVERITGVTVNMPKLTSTVAAVTYEVESSKYTIKSDYNVTFSNFVFNEAFKNAYFDYDSGFDELGHCIDFYHSPNTDNRLIKYTSIGVEFLNGKDVIGYGTGRRVGYCDGIIGCMFMYDIAEVVDNFNYVEGELIAQFIAVSADYFLGTIDLSVSSTYGGNTYSSVSRAVEIWVDGASLHIPVSTISLDNGSIVF